MFQIRDPIFSAAPKFKKSFISRPPKREHFEQISHDKGTWVSPAPTPQAAPLNLIY